MASVKVHVPPANITLTMELSQQEAQVLKAVVQNEWTHNESPEICNIRQAIWDALSAVSIQA